MKKYRRGLWEKSRVLILPYTPYQKIKKYIYIYIIFNITYIYIYSYKIFLKTAIPLKVLFSGGFGWKGQKIVKNSDPFYLKESSPSPKKGKNPTYFKVIQPVSTIIIYPAPTQELLKVGGVPHLYSVTDILLYI